HRGTTKQRSWGGGPKGGPRGRFAASRRATPRDGRIRPKPGTTRHVATPRDAQNTIAPILKSCSQAEDCESRALLRSSRQLHLEDEVQATFLLLAQLAASAVILSIPGHAPQSPLP